MRRFCTLVRSEVGTLTDVTPLKDLLTSIITLQVHASDAETFLLRSIEWMTFLESMHEVALEQVTDISWVHPIRPRNGRLFH